MMTPLPLDFSISLGGVVQNSPLVPEIWVRTVRKTDHMPLIWQLRGPCLYYQRTDRILWYDDWL
jgi:hypothetical protein